MTASTLTNTVQSFFFFFFNRPQGVEKQTLPLSRAPERIITVMTVDETAVSTMSLMIRLDLVGGFRNHDY